MNDRLTIRWLRVAFTAAVAALVASSVTLLAGQGSPAGTRAAAGQANDPAKQEWIQLFNGRDLAEWTPKFAKHDLGVNLNDTFRAEGGLLRVRYDKWTAFNNEFGHLFYKQPFSYYRIVAEYRFVDAQLAGGPGWAQRNNGLMLHALDPRSMLKSQDFPISIEVQLLGGLGDGKPRPTANLCTPGTNVVMKGELFTPHCVNSASKTYDGDEWVRVEVEVHGDGVITHRVNGEAVLSYEKPQVGGGNVAKHEPAVKKDGQLLEGGSISLQAESHPVEFRKVELLNLVGCMDKKSKSYRPHFEKSDPAACR